MARWSLDQLLSVPRVRSYVGRQLGQPAQPLANAAPAAPEASTPPHPGVAFVPPGHFYSPLPDLDAVEAQAERLYTPPTHDDGIRLNLDAQKRLLTELGQYERGFDWSDHETPGRRYFIENGYFEQGDGMILYAMIRHFRPRRLIEVGSGHSSALAMDTNDRYCDPKMELSFIEPYPDRLRALMRSDDADQVKLYVAPVQEVPLELFETLEANDILFIDSSHVAKMGSDVNHLFFTVLPRLKPGVLIHVHDVFYPFEYPLEWMRQGRAWNELYLLRAFLQFNAAFEIVLYNNLMWHHAPGLVKQHLPIMAINPGGSIWLRKVA